MHIFDINSKQQIWHRECKVKYQTTSKRNPALKVEICERSYRCLSPGSKLSGCFVMYNLHIFSNYIIIKHSYTKYLVCDHLLIIENELSRDICMTASVAIFHEGQLYTHFREKERLRSHTVTNYIMSGYPFVVAREASYHNNIILRVFRS